MKIPKKFSKCKFTLLTIITLHSRPKLILDIDTKIEGHYMMKNYFTSFQKRKGNLKVSLRTKTSIKNYFIDVNLQCCRLR